MVHGLVISTKPTTLTIYTPDYCTSSILTIDIIRAQYYIHDILTYAKNVVFCGDRKSVV